MTVNDDVKLRQHVSTDGGHNIAGSETGAQNNVAPPITTQYTICPSILYFQRHGIALSVLEKATHYAASSGRPAAEELIRIGIISRSGFARIIAECHNFAFCSKGPDPHLLTWRTHKLTGEKKQAFPSAPDYDFSNIAAEYKDCRKEHRIYISCEPSTQKAIVKLMRHSQVSNAQVILTTSKMLHNSQFIAKQKMHLNNAINGLSKKYPDKSASQVISRQQGFSIIIALFGISSMLAYSPIALVLIIQAFLGIFYFAVIVMRAQIFFSSIKTIRESRITPNLLINDRELPIYTVMTALYKEAGQVEQLVKSLGRIDWPSDRLQILLICEADDSDTIAECRVHCDDDDRFQIVICPVSQPRTKPKALNFALPLVKGEFLVLYDAEDQPHYNQLREAYAKFSGNDNFACLQAPLIIHNDRQNWLSCMFAIEYLTLFTVTLPILERWHAPMPLGGTSNHFRAKVLREAGAWDPHNVTEDADLGIRLARYGFRCGSINLPTMEEAPPVFRAWFGQRTRWIKGWMQTYLVHMRNPVKCARELGILNMLYFHLLIAVVIPSTLTHPCFVIGIIYYVNTLPNITVSGGINALLLGISFFNFITGYLIYFLTVKLALTTQKKLYLGKSIIWMPLYWLLISIAAWRALIQLFYKPFLWEKTPHGLASAGQKKNKQQ